MQHLFIYLFSHFKPCIVLHKKKSEDQKQSVTADTSPVVEHNRVESEDLRGGLLVHRHHP